MTSNDPMASSLPAEQPDAAEKPWDSTGPRSAETLLRGPGCGDPWGDQFFLAGTAVGLAGLAVRARVVVDAVALAGVVRAAGLLFLAGAAVVVAFGVVAVLPATSSAPAL